MLYSVALVVARFLGFTFMRWEITGLDNLPRQGAVIVVSNHLSVADPFLLGFCLGRKMNFMAKEELFMNKLGEFFLRKLGAFPVRKTRFNKEALEQAYHVLADGQALVIFPEGGRSRGNGLKKAFDGPALIALRSQAQVLPIGITGTEVIKGIGWLWRRPKVKLNVGRSFSLPQADDKIDREKLSGCTDLIMVNIAGLLPPDYRGIYSRTGGPDDF